MTASFISSILMLDFLNFIFGRQLKLWDNKLVAKNKIAFEIVTSWHHTLRYQNKAFTDMKLNMELKFLARLKWSL